MKITFVVWAPYHRRAEILAEHLGASLKFIYCRRPNKVPGTPVRYLMQAVQTWRVLRQDSPDVIFVQNPPIFSALIVYLYARLYGSRYVIDSHTGAFLSPKWRWSVGLHRFLSKGALATIVHNSSQENIVRDWGCRYLVIGFTPGSYPPGEHFLLDEQFNVTLVSSFHEDEPLGLVFEAASLLPKMHFYITGDSRRITSSLLSDKPDNCTLTGYLSYDLYVGLLRESDAIMVLTTGQHTLLMGAFEAVSLGTPLIISDSPILRDYFSLGTVHVHNTVKGLYDGLCLAWRNQKMLQQEILTLREQLQIEWERKFAELQQLLHDPET